MDSRFYIYEFRSYGSKVIQQINGQYQMVCFLNKKYWKKLFPFNDKTCSAELDQIICLDRDSYITNLHYGYDVWRIF